MLLKNIILQIKMQFKWSQEDTSFLNKRNSSSKFNPSSNSPKVGFGSNFVESSQKPSQQLPQSSLRHPVNLSTISAPRGDGWTEDKIFGRPSRQNREISYSNNRVFGVPSKNNN